MKIFELLRDDDYEQVIFFNDKTSNLKAIVAIHNTSLGPALGGCRMFNYASEEEALKDVLNLAKGMTYKAAAAGLDLGGGKAVIIGNPKTDKSEYLLRTFAKYIQSLKGRYIVSKDVGTTVSDLYTFKTTTNYVTGLANDPSIYTAYGVLQGIKAALNIKFNNENLQDLKVAIQGIGAVGYNLAKLLFNAGCKLYVADVNSEILQKAKNEFNAEIVSLDEIHKIQCDIYAPCALGQIINEKTIPEIKAKIIAGSANNQLSADEMAELLKEKDILYCPDYVINAGGLIAVAIELEDFNEQEIYKKCDLIYSRLLNIFNIAKFKNITTAMAANEYVQQHLNLVSKINMLYA